MILGKDGVERLPPPVGTSDWATFSRDSYCVDKTLMIKELIDTKTRVALFTRPRRFGKTTALEMIRAFYEGDASLFEDKKIWAEGEQYRDEQGARPVIFLTFKDIKQRTAEEAFEKLTTVVASEIGRYREAVEKGLMSANANIRAGRAYVEVTAETSKLRVHQEAEGLDGSMILRALNHLRRKPLSRVIRASAHSNAWAPMRKSGVITSLWVLPLRFASLLDAAQRSPAITAAVSGMFE